MAGTVVRSGYATRAGEAPPARPSFGLPPGYKYDASGKVRDAKGRMVGKAKLEELGIGPAPPALISPAAAKAARAAERDDGTVHFDCPRYASLKIRCDGVDDGWIRFAYGRYVTANPAAIDLLRSKRFRNRYGIYEQDGDRPHRSADGTSWWSEEARLAHDKLILPGPSVGHLEPAPYER